jgi:hypothetical protein
MSHLMNGREPEPPVTWQVRVVVALLIAARMVVRGLTCLVGACHRARCKECRHAR